MSINSFYYLTSKNYDQYDFSIKIQEPTSVERRTHLVFESSVKNKDSSQTIDNKPYSFSPHSLDDPKKYEILMKGLEILGGKKKIETSKDGTRQAVFSFSEDKSITNDPLHQLSPYMRVSLFLNYLCPNEHAFLELCIELNKRSQKGALDTDPALRVLKTHLPNELWQRLSELAQDKFRDEEANWKLYDDICSADEIGTVWLALGEILFESAASDPSLIKAYFRDEVPFKYMYGAIIPFREQLLMDPDKPLPKPSAEIKQMIGIEKQNLKNKTPSIVVETFRQFAVLLDLQKIANSTTHQDFYNELTGELTAFLWRLAADTESTALSAEQKVDLITSIQQEFEKLDPQSYQLFKPAFDSPIVQGHLDLLRREIKEKIGEAGTQTWTGKAETQTQTQFDKTETETQTRSDKAEMQTQTWFDKTETETQTTHDLLGISEADLREEVQHLTQVLGSMELFRRLTLPQITKFAEDMVKVQDNISLSQYAAFARDVKNHRLTSPLLSLPNWAAILTLCLVEKKISMNDFALICCYHAFSALPKFKVHSLKSPDGQCNRKEAHLLAEALKATISDKVESYLEQIPQGLGEFFSVVISDNELYGLVDGEMTPTLYTILSKTGVSCRKLSDNSYQFFIPQPATIEFLLEKEYGEQVIRPNLVIGFSTAEDFERSDRRDVLLPFPYGPVPNRIDGFFVKDGTSVYIHDLSYHLVTEAFNPFKDLLINVAKMYPKDSLIYNVIIDREVGGLGRPDIRTTLMRLIIGIFMKTEESETTADRKLIFDRFIEEFNKTQQSDPAFYEQYKEDIQSLDFQWLEDHSVDLTDEKIEKLKPIMEGNHNYL